MNKKNELVGTLLLAGALALAEPASAQALPDSTASVQKVTPIRASGGRLDWSPDGKKIVFDAVGADGYFDVYTMNEDGSDESCLTCGKSEVSVFHSGNPVWHPSGEYIAFQSVDAKYPGIPGLGIYYTNPGAGTNNDLWVMKADGSQFWRMTDLGKGGGVLHPQFSHDGQKIIWAERVSEKGWPLGQWALKMADFNVTLDGPKLGNIQDLRPGGFQMYESHGFSPDDKQILFTGSPANFYKSDIYLFDLTSGALKSLTDPKTNDWDEHAHFLPDGEHIVWMSSRGIPQFKNNPVPVTDYWVMRADGSNKQRLTHFNDKASGSYLNRTAADWSPHPDGRRFLAYLISRSAQDRKNGPGLIVLVDYDLGQG